jgi:hypothetical protein
MKLGFELGYWYWVNQYPNFLSWPPEGGQAEIDWALNDVGLGQEEKIDGGGDFLPQSWYDTVRCK